MLVKFSYANELISELSQSTENDTGPFHLSGNYEVYLHLHEIPNESVSTYQDTS